jgi:hypothetical protein
MSTATYLGGGAAETNPSADDGLIPSQFLKET